MLWLNGCGMGGFEAERSCPPVVEYSTEDQARSTDEVEALLESAAVVAMLSDYATLRDQARACKPSARPEGR